MTVPILVKAYVGHRGTHSEATVVVTLPPEAPDEAVWKEAERVLRSATPPPFNRPIERLLHCSIERPNGNGAIIVPGGIHPGAPISLAR